jgi:RNA polymerase-binding transcription factor DksA
MNKQLLEENKAKLLAERKRLESIFKHDDVVDTEIPGGHRPKFNEVGSEEGENASEVEQFGNDLSVTENLGERLVKVKAALERIEDGTYGKCSVGGEEIEEARMQAEPAADTCVAHAK